MAEIRQVRLSGFGGQGVVLAGMLLGEAGVIEGRHVAGSNSYGAQARGSGCKSEVVFSDGPIDFPHVVTADILVAMSQGAYQYVLSGREGRIRTHPLRSRPGDSQGRPESKTDRGSCHRICFEEIEEQAGGQHRSLGKLSSRSQRSSLPGRFGKPSRIMSSERFKALNLKALRIGMELGRRFHG